MHHTESRIAAGAEETHVNNRQNEKEITMETNSTFECGICYYQSQAKDFTPITVSADFAALECPKCLNNDADSFCEVETSQKLAA